MKKNIYLLLLINLCVPSLTNCSGISNSDSNETSSKLSDIDFSEKTSSFSETNSLEESSSSSELSVEESSFSSLESSEAFSSDSESSLPEIDDNYDALLDEDYNDCLDLKDATSKISNWNSNYADTYQFSSKDKIVYEEAYKNNVKQSGTVNVGDNDDIKYLFYNNSYSRFVNKADGYAFSIPTETTLQADFSIGAYRSKLYNKDFTLNISYEHSNPYNKWETYRSEWLFRYLDNENFYKQNDLKLLGNPRISDTKFLKGYIIDEYDLMINNPHQIKKNYYNIAVIRKSDSIKDFILLVMKSTRNMTDEFENIILSYKPLAKVGTANNSYMNNLPAIGNDNWNEETKEYYKQLLEEERTGWGAFTATLTTGVKMPSVIKMSNAYKKLGALSEALDYQFDLLPTYQHIAWNRESNNSWPTSSANIMAGGNGKNGSPVIQMSYQFTDNNNNVSVANKSDCYTPMFDIYRGNDGTGIDIGIVASPQNRYELAMISLAEEIKAYEHPVLFRLNNEMNTDWTSYCGMLTLLDSDIFQATWRIIYNIFEKVGVQNCIWIFNPIAKTCPFSSWGEDLCYYPGLKYVQALGLTSYEDNNNNNVNETTFRRDYTILYEKNNPVWKNYPWIISEFGCGSGGSTTGTMYRNQASQVKYIKGMFKDFNNRSANPYLQNIKGAVWFSVNDYSGDEVVNQYELVIDKLQDTIAALKEGLAPNKLS